ncbi:MAG: hypothetical protein RBR45_11260 [Pseudomonas sp.]|nr:hypothetical protein [Pseudomonas sp.]
MPRYARSYTANFFANFINDSAHNFDLFAQRDVGQYAAGVMHNCSGWCDGVASTCGCPWSCTELRYL